MVGNLLQGGDLGHVQEFLISSMEGEEDSPRTIKRGDILQLVLNIKWAPAMRRGWKMSQQTVCGWHRLKRRKVVHKLFNIYCQPLHCGLQCLYSAYQLSWKYQPFGYHMHMSLQNKAWWVQYLKHTSKQHPLSLFLRVSHITTLLQILLLHPLKHLWS